METRTARAAPMRAAVADEDEFTRLYQETYPSIARYLLRRGAGHASADLAAETFVVAWRRRGQWLPLPPERRLAWLYGVARMVLLSTHRATRQSSELISRAAVDASLRGTDRLADHSDLTVAQIVVADAMARLSEKDRELILLIAWEGLTPSQAAEVLGCRLGTVTSRLNRARNRLKKLLEASDPKESP